MKAIVVNEYGGPEVLALAELPDPRPGPGEALIEVRATSVNKRDVWDRRGLREPGLPRILGSDAAGRVIAVGAGVDTDWIEKNVVLLPYLYCGRCPSCLAGAENCCERLRLLGGAVDGGYAELLTVPEASLFHKPAGLSFEEAAAMPVVYLSAWHLIGTRADFAAVLRLAEQGVFRPVIDQVFRLDRAADAHRRIESTEHFGKVVLSLGHVR